MRNARVILALIVLAAFGPLTAGDLPPAVQAKFLGIISRSANCGGKVDCHFDPTLSKGLGADNDPSSKVAWGTNEAQVKALKAEGKLVICPSLDLLPKGGSIAIVEEDNKPQIYLHLKNITLSGVTVSDAILKIGKKL